jgi:undecaprenyl phosphate-alpha-L-ara4FN deformylase
MSDPFIGLRVDVDTLRGTREGVPELVRMLGAHGVTASFFFSVGPDNMGRHLWRLLKPRFLVKMLRSRAASLYGWSVLLRGTLWPGPRIGRRLGPVLRACADAGHEIGLHAWDHHRWQVAVDRLGAGAVQAVLERGVAEMERIGVPPTCSAAPAWRITDAALEAKERMGRFRYGSDCRGEGVFLPRVRGRVLTTPQVPVNLPTYDEVVGREVAAAEWNGWLLDRIRPGAYNVLTVHAEVEGIACAGQFDRFVHTCRDHGWRLGPLSELLSDGSASPPVAALERTEVTGREGWLSVRAPAAAETR